MMIFATLLILMGVVGETGVAPFYATKAEMFRTPGSPLHTYNTPQLPPGDCKGD